MKKNLEELFAREYQAPYSKSVEIIVDTSAQSFAIPDLEFFKEHFIFGVVIRKQNEADTRRSRSGYKLLNDSLLNRTFVTLSQNQTVIFDKLPAELLVHEPSGQAGSYAQLLIEEGFSPQNSNIFIAGGAPVLDGETKRAFELTFYYLPKTLCSKVFSDTF